MTGLATLSEASAYKALGGGGGARPTDPSALAARALNAAMGDDRETALKLFDYGVENYGTDFVTAYNGLRDSRELGEASVTPSKPGVLKQVIDSIKVGDGNAPVELPDELPFAKTPDRPQVQGPPWQTNSVELDRAIPGSAYRESIIPTPGQPIVVPNAPQVPVVRPDRNEASTLRGQTFRGSATEEAVARGVPLAQVEAERAQETEAARAADAGPPAVPAVPAPPAATPATPPPPPPPLAVVTDNVPGIATPPGGGGLATLRGSPAAGTAEGQQRLDAPDVATTAAPETPPPPTRRYGLQRDGTYVDAPPGDATALPEGTVTVDSKTGLPARTAGSGVRNVGPPRQRAAPPDSGGLASTVQPPAAVDTGTNTAAPPAPPAPPAAAAAVDTNQAPAADDSGFMGKPDVWSFLTSAGLGAMASGSPNFLGAVGAGGRAGIEQLGSLRKEQRERMKNLADARFQENRIKLGYYDTNAANQRNTDTLKSGERNTDVTTGAANQRNTDTLRSGERNTDVTNAGQTERTVMTTQSQERTNQAGNDAALARIERQGELTRLLEEEKDRRLHEGKSLDRMDIYDFTIKHGGTEQEARDAANGFRPGTPDKLPPLSDKDVTLTHNMVATKIFGVGGSGETLLATLPPDVSIEYQKAVSSQHDAAGAYAAGMAVLKKYNITEGKKDGSYWPGEQPELHVPKVTPAPPGAGGGGGSGGYVWDPVKKVMVPK